MLINGRAASVSVPADSAVSTRLCMLSSVSGLYRYGTSDRICIQILQVWHLEALSHSGWAALLPHSCLVGQPPTAALYIIQQHISQPPLTPLPAEPVGSLSWERCCYHTSTTCANLRGPKPQPTCMYEHVRVLVCRSQSQSSMSCVARKPGCKSASLASVHVHAMGMT